ncbi:KTSC domain-containing protein [Rheinheimera sp. SA_1]|uniref:KTSC domain-containing protein n=1 Tax=Rheinheimera sp. SA_1 TaxID=1827365 RepID=UPI0009EF5A1F|nr:KTSC domain-containing protein [Rheinheimera sp. SA_1]
MERVSVSSSNIDSVGYDEYSSTLEIAFHNGSVYQYFDVPQQEYIALVNAGSVGGYLANNIKGKYRYSKI